MRLYARPWRDVARFAGPSIAEMFLNIGPANSFSLYIGYNDTFIFLVETILTGDRRDMRLLNQLYC